MDQYHYVSTSFIGFCFFIKRSKQSLKILTKNIDFRYYGFVAIGTVIGCFGMLFSFEPLYSSIYIIFLTIVSRFLFKEKLKKENYLSIGLALISVVFCSI